MVGCDKEKNDQEPEVLHLSFFGLFQQSIIRKDLGRKRMRELCSRSLLRDDMDCLMVAEHSAYTDLHSSGDRGGSEEPHPHAGTQAYPGVRRGERRSDNEGIRLNANRY